MKTILTISILLAGASGLRAQNNPLSADAKRFYEGTRNNLLRAAEKVPEADYNFKPTPDVRTFGEEVAHAAEWQTIACSAAKEEQQPNPVAGKTSKADIIAALKASSDYCDAVYAVLTDATGAQTVKFLGRDLTRLGALMFNYAHDNETYGTMVPYMRLLKIVPPTSEPRGAGKKQ